MRGNASVSRCPGEELGPHRPPGTRTSETMETALESAGVQLEEMQGGRDNCPYEAVLTAKSNYTEKAVTTDAVA